MSDYQENQEIDQVEISRSGLYYVIPASIMDLPHDVLKPLEKLLYTFLSGLAHSNGECFPSDEYLAERVGGVSRKHVNEMIGNLEKQGFITRRTESHPNNPFRRRRIITVIDPFKKCLRSNPQVTLHNHPQVTPQSHPQVTIVSKEIVSEEKRKKESTLKRAKEKSPEAPICFVFENVKIEKEHYEKLVHDLGQEVVDFYITELNNYSLTKPKEFRKYERHDLVIRNWLSRAEKRQLGGISSSQEEKRKKVSQKIEAIVASNKSFSGSVNAFHDRIEIFKGGRSEPVEIKYNDVGFLEVLKNEFRKLNWTFPESLTQELIS